MSSPRKNQTFPTRRTEPQRHWAGTRSSVYRWRGFSLLELIVVMAMIVIIMAFTVPAFRGLGKAQKLRVSGNKVSGLLNAARQTAITQNTLTAVVAITDPAVANSHRALSLWQMEAPSNSLATTTATWKQVSKWELLAEGIIIDPRWPLNSTQSFADSTSGQPLLPGSMALPSSIRYGTQQANAYKYIVFLPSGGTYMNTSTSFSQLQLVEGFLPEGSGIPIFTNSANYYRIIVLAASGRLKIE